MVENSEYQLAFPFPSALLPSLPQPLSIIAYLRITVHVFLQ